MTNENESLNEKLGELDKDRSFNVFEAAGLVHQEIRHSHFLSHLLDPRETHGLGPLGTNALLRNIFGSHHEILDVERVTVEREVDRIDFKLIDNERKQFFVVENKIWAGEHGNQLKDYKEVMQNRFPEFVPHFAFLTPDDREASDDDYKSASYTHVATAIEEILETGKGAKGVRPALQSYLDLLRRHILPDTAIHKRCKEIWESLSAQRRESLLAADDLPDFLAGYSRAGYLLKSHRFDLRRALANLAKELRAVISKDVPGTSLYSSIAYTSFRPAQWHFPEAALGDNPKDGNPFPLFLEFETRHEAISLGLHIVRLGESPDDERSAAHKSLKPHGFPGFGSELNDDSTRIFQCEIVSTEIIENSNWLDVRLHACDQVREFLRSDFPKLDSAVRKIDWP